MSRPLVVLLTLCCLTATVPPTAVGSLPADSSSPSPPTPADTPAVAAVYPNPVAEGDASEFVVLDVPATANLSVYRLCDDEGCLRPAGDATGRVVVTAAPDEVRVSADLPVVTASGDLSLANGGERLRLVVDETTVATLRYGDAPEAEVYRRDGTIEEWSWRPLGATDYPVVKSGPANVTAFALPDAPEVVTGALAEADDRLYLAGYTFPSSRVADGLLAAHRRGAEVRVLIEGGPVGGVSRTQARTLDRLVRAGVPVRVVDGSAARYDYHHSKYAVVDDRALVLIENWKPSGTGGNSSRGWAAVVHDDRTADVLARTFRGDFDWRAAREWRSFREGRSFQSTTPSNATFPTQFTPETLRAEQARLLVAPDNAESGVRSVLRNATDSVAVVQVGLGGPNGPFARELLAAAERGVEVRVLLSEA